MDYCPVQLAQRWVRSATSLLKRQPSYKDYRMACVHTDTPNNEIVDEKTFNKAILRLNISIIAKEVHTALN